MTSEFLNSIKMLTLAEYKEYHGDSEETEITFYQTVLHQTDEFILSSFESFLSVFDNSTVITLPANLIKWAIDTKTTISECLSARYEAREFLRTKSGGD